MKRFFLLFLFILMCFPTVAYAKEPSQTYTSSSEETVDSSLTDKSNVNITPVTDYNMSPSNEERLYTSGNKLIKIVKITVFGCIGLVDMFAIAVFIGRLLLLANSGSNIMARTNALKGIQMAGIMLALLGSITLIFVLFYNILK